MISRSFSVGGLPIWYVYLLESNNGDVIGFFEGVDNEGEALDSSVQSKRTAKTALKLMGKVLKKQG